MKIDYNPRATRFELYPTTSEEFHKLKLIYDTQNKIKTGNTITELIKNMFKYTIDGKEVTADEFIAHYNKLLQNSAYGKLATDYIGKDKKRKFITVHKHNDPNVKATIFIDQIQAILERDNGYASIRLSTCNFDTCDKYDKIIKQLS